jgi:hypothetical protein
MPKFMGPAFWALIVRINPLLPQKVGVAEAIPAASASIATIAVRRFMCSPFRLDGVIEFYLPLVPIPG